MLDKNNREINLGDTLVSDNGYSVTVVEGEDGEWTGKLICEPDHPCRDIPYHLNNGKGHSKLKVHGLNVADELYCYIECEEDIPHAIDCTGTLPDYTEPFHDLLEEYRKDVVWWDGEGVYQICYSILNPCNHGLWIKKMDSKEAEAVGSHRRETR